MKSRTLPVKRTTAKPGVFKRLAAVTGRRQRAATATGEGIEGDGSSKISRALTIIFLIHIVAIGLIFFHQKFLDGRSPEIAKATAPEKSQAASPRTDLPKLSDGSNTYIPLQGDNYAKIAAKFGVVEADLRNANKGVDIGPSVILTIPPRHLVAAEPAEVAAIRAEPAERSDGLVPAVPVDYAGAPRAQLVKPKIVPGGAVSASAAGGSSYVVKSGDSVWRIANRFKVNQKDLMKANGITDARKMKIGMKLTIPR